MRVQDMVKVTCPFNGSIATNGTAFINIDTRDHKQVQIAMIHPEAAATNSSAKWAVLHVSDGTATATNSADYTAIDGLSGTTNATAASNEFVLGAHNNTTDQSITLLNVNLENKERYLMVTASIPAATNYVTNVVCMATFYDMPESPSSASEAGAVARAWG